MGNEYNRFNHHHHHHHHQHHNLHMHNRSTYLPMLCSRPSIKDVRLPNANSFSSSENDPLSPRISCMGQVKRNNKVGGFPTPHRLLTITNNNTTKNTTTTTIHNTNNVKYSKLKKLFSSKNLTPTTTSTAASAAAATATTTGSATGGGGRRKRLVNVNVNAASCGRPRINMGHTHNNDQDHDNCVAMINILELDPPLPVIKKVHKPAAQEEEVGSLWKRRSGGVALQGLQLKQIHQPKHHLQPTTV